MVAVGLIAALFGLVGASVAVAQNHFAKQQSQLAVQAAALAAADSLNGFTTGYPCQVAQRIAEENMAKLVECRIVGFETFVTTKVETLGMVHFASARAASQSTVQSRER